MTCDGAIFQRPFCRPPRSAAKQAGESKRGQHSQSIETSRPTSAAEWPSPIRGESSIFKEQHRLDVVFAFLVSLIPFVQAHAPRDKAIEPRAIGMGERLGSGVV